MKKNIFTAAIMAMMLSGFAACSSDETTEGAETGSMTSENYHITLKIGGNGTRATLNPTGSGDDVWLDAKWDKGDEITVYHYTDGKADPTALTLKADESGDIVTFSGEESVAKGTWKVGDYIIATFPKAGNSLTMNNNDGTLSAHFTLNGQDGTLATIQNKYNLETAAGKVTHISTEGDVRVELVSEQFRSMVAVARYAFYVNEGGSYKRLTDYSSLEVGNLILKFNLLKGGESDQPNLYYVDKPDAYTPNARGSVTFNGTDLATVGYMPYVVFPLDDPDSFIKDENGQPTTVPEHYSAPTFILTKDGVKYRGQIGGKANGYESDTDGAQYQAGRYYQVNVLLERMD